MYIADSSEVKETAETTKRHAVIVGGGIAGLATAICLSLKNWRVSIYEQSPAFEEIGAGVQISPNGSRILERIGVLERIADSCFEPIALEMRHGRSNRRLLYLPMGDQAIKRWQGQYLQVYRPDLIRALLDVLESTEDVAIHNGVRVSHYGHDASGATVMLDKDEQVDADLLVAADGVHSTIRQQMTGDDKARFTGNVAWRALVPVEQLRNPPPLSACVWTGEGKHAVTTRVRGGEWVNFVGIVEQDDWHVEGWREKGSSSEALQDFGNWNDSITDIIQVSGDLYRWALLDRPPLPKWSDKAAVLIGDAAHAMLPSMAQGAVQCIEDAWVLADCHQRNPDAISANQDFYRQRIERTRRIQKQSADNLRLFHKRGFLSQVACYAPIWLAGKLLPGAVYRRNDWVYGQGPL